MRVLVPTVCSSILSPQRSQKPKTKQIHVSMLARCRGKKRLCLCKAVKGNTPSITLIVIDLFKMCIGNYPIHQMG